MTERSYTPPLFITAPQPDQQDTDAPRCRMCVRPAHLRRNGEYSSYCGSSGACTNRKRLCQSCGDEFTLNADGAGTKYCSTKCKRAGYGVAWARPDDLIECAWGCGNQPTGRWAPVRLWPYICQACLDPIRHLVARLKQHRVSHERARQLLDNPGCEVCGTDIVTKQYDHRTGRTKALLVVDHDHRCCPGDKSCGQCVRGLLCQNCNAAAGMVGDDPSRARALADYLTLSALAVHDA
jgi:hypothetical protein